MIMNTAYLLHNFEVQSQLQRKFLEVVTENYLYAIIYRDNKYKIRVLKKEGEYSFSYTGNTIIIEKEYKRFSRKKILQIAEKIQNNDFDFSDI